MPTIEVRDMVPADEKHVGSCSRPGGQPEVDECGRRRLQWIKQMQQSGLQVKVALLDGGYAGAAYVMPIEICPWCPTGRDLMALPCLSVEREPEQHGVGHALLEAAEEETRRSGRKALVIVAHRQDFWAVSPGFFEQLGYEPVSRRGEQVLMWKRFDPKAEKPEFIKPKYRYKRVKGKVVVDLFYNTFCQPSNIEAHRVREVVAEFGDKVVLNEYCADERKVLEQYGIPRGIFINGREVGWAYEAPRQGLREDIERELGRTLFG